jgi:hypothetical protein
MKMPLCNTKSGSMVFGFCPAGATCKVDLTFLLVSQLCDQKPTIASLPFVDGESGFLCWAVLPEDQNLEDIISRIVSSPGLVTMM